MRYSLLFLFVFILAACGPKPDPEAQIRQIVAATLAAIPKTTVSPPPTPIPIPTATPFDLTGLFCEYQFCIGHPADMAFYDVSAVQSNQANPSTYQTGLMAAFSGNLFILLTWQFSPGTSDPRFLLDLILEDVDTSVGTPEVKLIRDMNVVYTSITTTASTLLPFGGAASWTCGERVFAWRVYTPDEASPAALFDSALSRFVCKK